MTTAPTDSAIKTDSDAVGIRSSALFAISRVWCMPSPLTFSVKPIRAFVERWLRPVSVDCFARDCQLADITNDLNPATKAMHHMDVLDFAEWLGREGIRPACILFDPPYSPRQAADCYEAAGVDPKTLDAVKRRKGNAWQRTKNWKEERDALARIQGPGDVVLSFGWDSCGMGKKRGYELAEVLLVCHGACHNDTICIAERRVADMANAQDHEPRVGSGA